MGKRKLKSKGSEEKSIEQFRAVIDNSTTLSMYNEKRRSVCIVRKNLAKDYDIEVDASEAPVLNKFSENPQPFESSMANLNILEEEVFPLIDAFKIVFGEEKELKLRSIKLAVGGSKNDYVSIREKDLIKYDVKPTLSGLKNFIKENDESILGFLDSEYVSEEGNVIYLKCEKRDVSDDIYSIKIKILASMQQRGYFLQQEHKYYGLQLFIIIESRKPNSNKLLEFLKELGIDWELIFFRRRLAIHDWTEIECQANPDNLKSYLRVKYDTLNYFDINNMIRLIVHNELPFNVADKMGSLLYKMKSERSFQLREKKNHGGSNYEENFQNRVTLRRTNSEDPVQSVDEYSLTLKKAEIAAAAKIACAYLGVPQEIEFDKDISDAEILKYQHELTNF
ncbi:MAG: hypothetical protein KGD72_01960 [Candidatus Lokiarchaeota archaeon]|nr:hypothetical protein [Candidatus Lokiarchaeota archaeon]